MCVRSICRLKACEILTVSQAFFYPLFVNMPKAMKSIKAMKTTAKASTPAPKAFKAMKVVNRVRDKDCISYFEERTIRHLLIDLYRVRHVPIRQVACLKDLLSLAGRAATCLSGGSSRLSWFGGGAHNSTKRTSATGAGASASRRIPVAPTACR